MSIHFHFQIGTGFLPAISFIILDFASVSSFDQLKIRFFYLVSNRDIGIFSVSDMHLLLLDLLGTLRCPCYSVITHLNTE